MKEKRSRRARVRKGADEIRGTASGVPWTWAMHRNGQRENRASVLYVLSLRRDYAHG
jgi:hypothetical protein